MVPQGQYLVLHSCSSCSLHKNTLLIPWNNQLLCHSWKTPSTLLLWRLHTLVNVLLVSRKSRLNWEMGRQSIVGPLKRDYIVKNFPSSSGSVYLSSTARLWHSHVRHGTELLRRQEYHSKGRNGRYMVTDAPLFPLSPCRVIVFYGFLSLQEAESRLSTSFEIPLTDRDSENEPCNQIRLCWHAWWICICCCLPPEDCPDVEGILDHLLTLWEP